MPQNDPQFTIPGMDEIVFNPLQKYRNVTYNVRLTMMPRKESNIKDDERSYDYTRGYIMTETGGTGSINLEELRITMAGPGNPTANYTLALPAQMSMKLIEPIGSRFIEALSLAAFELGYRRNHDALYLLEIWFTGYDESDMPVKCKNFDGKSLVYRWYVRITELKTQIDHKGGTYNLKLVVANGVATLADVMNLEQGFNLKAQATIQEQLKELEAALNEREKQKVKAGLRQHPHKYVINAHKDIANIAMSNSGSARLWWFNFTGGITIAEKVNILVFINQTLSTSPAFLKYLHKIAEGKKDFNSPDTKPNTLEHLVKQIAIINGSITQKAQGEGNDDILFDEKLHAPAQEIHIFVTTAANPKSIISPREYIDAKDAAQRNNRVQQWLKMGLLRKAYKWIYTGENVEVLKAEIKIDSLWRIVRPLFYNGSNGELIVNGHSANPAASQPNPARRPNPQQQRQLTPQQQRQRNKENANGSAAFRAQFRDYAEDLPARGDNKRDDDHPQNRWRPSFYHANIELSAEQAKQSVFAESAFEYSVFRQIHQNVGAGSQDMNTLDLEVVGDPYYLCQVPPDEEVAAPPKDEETVWQWEKHQWTDMDLVPFRQKAATLTTRPNFWFEAQTPSASLTADDRMALRPQDSITGIYNITSIENIFQKGKYTTKLKSYRDVLANPWTKRDKAPQSDANNRGAANRAGPTNNRAGPNPRSDRRLKTNIKYITTTESGINLYRFNYVWDNSIEYVGVMAQEILEIMPSAVEKVNGYYVVYYDMLGLKMMTYDEYKLQNQQDYGVADV